MLAQKNNSLGLVVGAFQAKTYFAELLRKVEDGSVVTITRNGHNVAVMQSPKSLGNEKALKSWGLLLEVAQQISDQNKEEPVTLNDIQEWKIEGRK